MIRVIVILFLSVYTMRCLKHNVQDCSRNHFYNVDLGRCTKCHMTVCFPGIPFGCHDTCVQNYAKLFANDKWETGIKTYKDIQQKLEDIHGDIIRLVSQSLNTTGGESERLINQNTCDENCFKDLNFIYRLALFICVFLVLNAACLSILIYSSCKKNKQYQEMLEKSNDKLAEQLATFKNEVVSPQIPGQVEFQRQCSIRSSSSA
ncbi:uncharacterized protein LOC128224097 [Mya arenaria]|uniref:uncharacterized protein LOC128224097 n=1 Tax=Mya arenaria TaxID=6604 RepID=UPI0022E5E1D4|nr:uncharacterized protein LOC128224097 [Mya arenaria]